MAPMDQYLPQMGTPFGEESSDPLLLPDSLLVFFDSYTYVIIIEWDYDIMQWVTSSNPVLVAFILAINNFPAANDVNIKRKMLHLQCSRAYYVHMQHSNDLQIIFYMLFAWANNMSRYNNYFF